MQIILMLAVLSTGFLQLPDAANPPPCTLCVLLSVFSGRSDPQWLVTSSHPKYAEIMEKYKSAKSKGETKTVDYMPSILGYRGFLVKEKNSTAKQLDYIVGTSTTELQQLLLQSIPEGKLNKNFVKTISKSIAKGVQPRSQPAVTQNKRYNVNYPDNSWNQPGVIGTNHCYNYASDIKAGGNEGTADPGIGGGRIYTGYTNQEMTEACVRDGYRVEAADDHDPVPVLHGNDRHLVSFHLLNIDEYDYHLYRLDTNNHGQWSHKPGITATTDRDDNGAQINDPRTAATPPAYPYHFVTFLSVDKTDRGTRVRGERDDGGCCIIL